MRKLLLILLLVFIAGFSYAKKNDTDSSGSGVGMNIQPMEEFRKLNQAIDDIFTNGSGNIDYSTCVKMVKIGQQLKSDSLLAIAYNTIGNYFLLNNGDFSNALEYFFKGIPLAEKANDKRRLSSLYIDIAVTYYRLNNPEQQIRYLRQAMANLPDKTSPFYYFMLVQVQSYTCRYFILKQQADSAFFYVHGLQESNQHLQSQVYKSSSESLLGNIYTQTGDTAKALLHFKNAIATADSVRYFYIKQNAKTLYIDFLISNKKMNEALIQSRQLMQLGLEKNNADVIRLAAGYLREIAAYHHQPDSAYHYALLESAMKDSVFNQRNFNKIQSLAFTEQLRQIEEEARRAAEEEQRKHNIQYALIAVGIITFIILFLVFGNWFITNAKLISFLIIVALLLVFEFLNLLLHPFLGKITHHSPFLMLVAMVCVAAILVPLHHKLEHWAMHKLVQKNKHVRQVAGHH